MVPGLTKSCKQTRLETRRIFLEENDFEMPAEMMHQQRGSAPFLNFRTMHHNVGLELQTLQVSHGTKYRVNGDLFQLTTSFTLSKVPNGLSITNQVFSGTYIGRTAPGQTVPRITVCAYAIDNWVDWFSKGAGADDMVLFLKEFQERFLHGARSCNSADLSRCDEVVWRGYGCLDCARNGLDRVVYFVFRALLD